MSRRPFFSSCDVDSSSLARILSSSFDPVIRLTFKRSRNRTMQQERRQPVTSTSFVCWGTSSLRWRVSLLSRCSINLTVSARDKNADVLKNRIITQTTTIFQPDGCDSFKGVNVSSSLFKKSRWEGWSQEGRFLCLYQLLCVDVLPRCRFRSWDQVIQLFCRIMTDEFQFILWVCFSLFRSKTGWSSTEIVLDHCVVLPVCASDLRPIDCVIQQGSPHRDVSSWPSFVVTSRSELFIVKRTQSHQQQRRGGVWAPVAELDKSLRVALRWLSLLEFALAFERIVVITRDIA